ncbi:MAG: galactose mutarotase [Puniceicoccales bacterium]|jgi:aldose 1-epimerase|nr:galactose mutarotase [Puniceicoccales bacterium]
MKKLFSLCSAFLCVLLGLSVTGCTQATSSSEEWGGKDHPGVRLYTIDNGHGLRVRISNFGALLVSVETPDKNGIVSDVALGYATLEEYLKDSTYFGVVVGRVANRIAGGQFTLDGTTYTLPKNNTPGGIPCTLHGGNAGFSRVVWDAEPFVSNGDSGLRLTYKSKDGEEGFPGNLVATVTYTVLADNTLRVEYGAVTDKATPVNLSQHSYFNLAGEGNGDILSHEVRLNSLQFTPVNAGLIPTGELRSVIGTPFDFTKPHTVGERINAKDEQLELAGGYDHNWVLAGERGKTPRLAAEVYEPKSGRVLTISTTEPGIQYYSGNFLDGSLKGKSGKVYLKRGGLALETQHFPDSPNQSAFPSVILRPGEHYRSVTEFKFSTR